MNGPLNPFRLGIVGCGRITERCHAPAAAAIEGVRLVAVADPDPERRRTIIASSDGDAERESDVGGFASARDLISGVPLDGVIIASPAADHRPAAEIAAAASLPALIEKPPAETAEEARRLVGLEPAPAVGLNRRFGIAAGLAEAVGASGAPTSGGLELSAEINYRRRSWSPHTDLGDALTDLGPHLVDIALLAAGERPLQVVEAEVQADHFELALEGPGYRADLSGRTDAPWRERIRLRSTGGKTLFAARAGGLRGMLLDRSHDPLGESIERQLRAWIAGIRGGSDRGPLSPPADATYGARVMELLEETAGASQRRTSREAPIA